MPSSGMANTRRQCGRGFIPRIAFNAGSQTSFMA
jgi:hypothetical protein